MPQFKLPKINLPKLKLSASLIILGIVILWFVFGGYYIVEPDEKGVVLRFGSYVRTTDPGFHLKFPPPIERVYTPKVTEVKRTEVGFRIEDPGPPARYRDALEESLMLTGDENIIDLDVVAQYKIIDPVKYLFNVRGPSATVKAAAEAAIREIIGKYKIDEALTEGKFMIQEETRALLQKILDRYDSGLQIIAFQLQDVHPPQQVRDSFKDVASAMEDKNRLINESHGYRNSVIPEARGKVSQIIKVAQGYKEERINHAKGDAEKFTSILQEYRKARDVTRKRLYIETMEEVLTGIDKYIVEGKSGVLPLLPLETLKQVQGRGQGKEGK
ncbi:MAG TPA: FtsH protease activity modulator HflK [Nitrospinae bacterium]|nr:FtsH protease activity modulator HflK [Nitrospinota bacterium]HBA27103.1 FtsH protease activity modulator HflK [Nitrospinota bacterium]